MSKVLIISALACTAAVVCILAWWKGGSAERFGAAAIATAWLIVTLAQASNHNLLPIVWVLCADIALATCFLALALRYSSIWLGAAMLFQGVEIGGHAAILTSSISRTLYVWLLDIMSTLVLLAILGGTLASWSRRVAIRRSA